MDRKSVSFLALGLVCGLLLASAVFVLQLRAARAKGDVGAGGTVLKFAHGLDREHPVHVAIMRFSERVAELSGGALRVQVFPNGQLGSEPECLEQVQRGALALVKVSSAAMESFVPEMAVFGLPYLFRDEAHFWQVAGSPVGRELLAAGTSAGLHGLCFFEAGARSFYTVDRPVLRPEDVRELKLRVQASKMAIDMVKALGGGPTPIPWGELYTALQQGMVDGAENNPPSFRSSRHYEVAKHYSINEHTRVPDLVVISAALWSRLDGQQRAWLQEAANETVVFQRERWRQATEEALAFVRTAGVTIHRPDTLAFAQATVSLRRAQAGTRVGELARRIEETR